MMSPFVALSGHTETICYSSAFGQQRTYMLAWLRPLQSLMTHSCQSTGNFAVVHNGPHDLVVYCRRPMGGLGETASHYNS
jgi:hypothetical protein